MDTINLVKENNAMYVEYLISQGNRKSQYANHTHIHDGANNLIARTCGTCRILKPASMYNKKTTGFGGLQGVCASCYQEYNLNRYHAKNAPSESQRKAEEFMTLFGEVLAMDNNDLTRIIKSNMISLLGQSLANPIK